MRHDMVRANGIDLHVRSEGNPGAPLLLFLHGFPEYSGAWDEVLPAFAGTFHAVAPDQRGYARSSKPAGLEAYRVKHLVRDILALGEHYSPGRPFALVAHDWGASVAYATAIAAPARVAKLVVINGVHPGPFQRALIEDEGQRKASAYMHFLRSTRSRGAAVRQHLREAAGHALPLRTATLADASEARRLSRGLGPARRADRHAQLVSGRALVVPKEGETVDPAKVPKLDPAQLRVRMPHLVIWGMDDRALLPVSRATLPDYCDDLTVREIPGADHWIVHQKTDEVIDHIRGFLGA